MVLLLCAVQDDKLVTTRVNPGTGISAMCRPTSTHPVSSCTQYKIWAPLVWCSGQVDEYINSCITLMIQLSFDDALYTEPSGTTVVSP